MKIQNISFYDDDRSYACGELVIYNKTRAKNPNVLSIVFDAQANLTTILDHLFLLMRENHEDREAN